MYVQEKTKDLYILALCVVSVIHWGSWNMSLANNRGLVSHMVLYSVALLSGVHVIFTCG